MFTGIIQAVGQLTERTRRGAGALLTIRWQPPPDPLAMGESVAVNGVCLTVTAIRPDGFEADLSGETLGATTLGRLAPGSPVNLERALRPMDRLGGHLVQGHVDDVGRVTRCQPGSDGLLLEVAFPTQLERYIVHKGSITVDGISLTVAGLTGRAFRVAVVPHTAAVTIVEGYRPGIEVNLEVDVLARYVERMLGGTGARGRLESLLADGP